MWILFFELWNLSIFKLIRNNYKKNILIVHSQIKSSRRRISIFADIFFRILDFFAFVFLIQACHVFGPSEISCEKIGRFYWDWLSHQITCDLTTTTEIRSSNVTLIAQDTNTTGLRLIGNEKIEFLPTQLHKSFVELLAIDAQECSLKAISYANFEKLYHLEYLWLQNNQIERLEFADKARHE